MDAHESDPLLRPDVRAAVHVANRYSDQHTAERGYYELVGRMANGRLPRARRALIANSWWRQFPRGLFAGAAAGVLALSVAGVWHYQARQHEYPEIVHSTAVGESRTITLADGSQVTLAPKTELRTSSKFGEHDRTITLDGEAYFSVEANNRIPFIVETRRSVSRVLGTVFGVRAYDDDAQTRVLVEQGRVFVSLRESSGSGSGSGPGEGAVLTEGMVAIIGDSTAHTFVESNPARYSTWMHGRLVFQNAPMKDVLKTLNRWYGYEFRIADSALVNESVTVGLSTQSAANALASLKLTLDVDLSVNGNVVTMARRKKSRAPERAPQQQQQHNIPSVMEVGR